MLGLTENQVDTADPVVMEGDAITIAGDVTRATELTPSEAEAYQMGRGFSR